jgi:hypothetical protein
VYDVTLQQTCSEQSCSDCWTIYLEIPDFLLLRFPLPKIQCDKNSTHTDLRVHTTVVQFTEGYEANIEINNNGINVMLLTAMQCQVF